MELTEKPDSRRRILDAAIAEFAARGYEAASTNRICQQAEISKGLLFHYYQNKKKLFCEVVKQCVEDMERAEQPVCDGGLCTAYQVEEFFRRQLNFFADHFHHYSIIEDFISGTSAVCWPGENKLRENQIRKKSERFRSYLNHCPLRPGTDREVALELMLSATEQLQRKYLDKIRRHPESVKNVLTGFRDEYEKVLGILLNGMIAPSATGVEEDIHAACRN